MCTPLLIKDMEFEAFHYGPICVLKYGEKLKILETAQFSQTDAKQGQIALSCKTLWMCLRWHIISTKSFVNRSLKKGADCG